LLYDKHVQKKQKLEEDEVDPFRNHPRRNIQNQDHKTAIAQSSRKSRNEIIEQEEERSNQIPTLSNKAQLEKTLLELS
jgi:hypothetical protein